MSKVSPLVYARNALGTATLSGDPQRETEARRNLHAAHLEVAIQKALAAAPPLTTAQRERLAALLTGGDA